jgi:SMC interacting uncharacterized protein involved in chromosome segregation
MAVEDGTSRSVLLAEHLAGSRKLARDLQNGLTASQQAKAVSDQRIETLNIELERVHAELGDTKQECAKQVVTWVVERFVSETIFPPLTSHSLIVVW